VVVEFTPIAFTAYVVRLIPVHGGGIIHTTLCFKECLSLVAGWWFSPYIEVYQANSVITKNAIILNIIHNIFNLRDTEIVVCMLIILLKKADALNNI
jgi:hypothetical protein